MNNASLKCSGPLICGFFASLANLSYAWVFNYEGIQRPYPPSVQGSTVLSKRIKYLGVDLTKEVKSLYVFNYKILLKEIKEHQISGKTVHVHKLESLILL